MNALLRILLALAAAGLLVLQACKQATNADDDKLTGSISTYNHTAEYVSQLYVDGAWGGNSFAYGGGGKFTCCISYPRTWREDLKATVKWATSSSDPNATGDAAAEHWHEKVVLIEPYDREGGNLYVHFLPNGEVRLIISNKGAGHPDYPGPPAPIKPDDFPFQR